MVQDKYKIKIPKRCSAIEKAFAMYVDEIALFSKGQYYEFVEPKPDLKISKHVLFDTVLHYFIDIDRYKNLNGFKDVELANAVKVGAFSTYWLSAKCPIYDIADTSWAPIVNNKFALYAGLTFAEIDPHSASLVHEGRPYKQLMQLLSSKTGTPDSFVPIFEMLKLSCPHQQTAK
jgi:hypothetical protein